MNCFRAAAAVYLLLGSWAFAVTATPWPQDGSDLEPDPRVTYGQLDNGVRFAVMPNANPKSVLSLRLLVATGSLNEQADEKGVAHFVEHMAFNGTRHFPTGKLFEYLQRQGMGFGADVNATTSETATVYRLDLPTASPEATREALQVLRDYADGLIFPPAAVERERGVILAELRVRDNEGFRKYTAERQALFMGSLVPERPPLGDPYIVRSVSAEKLRAFYQAWYRPERMTVVAAGDVPASAIGDQIRQAFSDLGSMAPRRADYALADLSVVATPEVHIHRDPGEFGVGFALENVRNVPTHPYTKADYLRQLRVRLANYMLKERTRPLTARPNAPEGQFDTEDTLIDQRYGLYSFGCGARLDQWQTALQDLALQLRGAQSLGFTATELTRVRLTASSHYHDEVVTKDSRTSSFLAGALTESLLAEEVFLSPEATFAIVSEELNAVTPGVCQAALNNAWAAGRRIVMVTTNDSFRANAQDVAKVYRQSQVLALGAQVDQAVPEFGYTDFGPAGVITQKSYRAETDSWEVSFQNGVRLHFKHTAFEPGNISASIRFGTGRLREPKAEPGLSMFVIGQAIGGLGKHTFSELAQIFNGKNGAPGFGASSDGFQFAATTTSENALSYLQLLTALIVDPALRDDSRGAIDAALDAQYQRAWDGPQGVINELIGPQLAAGDLRAALPRRTALKAYSLKAYRDWFMKESRAAPMELTLVGDMAPEVGIDLAARTVGALPAVPPPPDLNAYRQLPVPDKPYDWTWTITDTKSHSDYLELCWFIGDPLSGADDLKLRLMMMILSDRLRVTVRQTMGDTYAPEASVDILRGFKNRARLVCLVESSDRDLKRVQKTCLELAEKMAKQGVTADELDRVQQVRLAEWDREQQRNEYWVFALDLAGRYPDASEILARGREIIRDATPTDVNALAKKYLRPGQASVFRIVSKDAPGH